MISGDDAFSGRLRDLLAEQGFRVEVAQNATRGLEIAFAGSAALVVLDETVPNEGGYEVLRRLRMKSRVPVLMLLRWDTPEERIASLEAGADDCLGNPFHPGELTARVRSILRRSEPGSLSRTLESNGIRLDMESREVFSDGAPVGLTSVEFDILAVLIRSAGHPVSRDELMEMLNHRKATSFDRSIDMHVSHLRKKFAAKADLIKTLRGEGYQFCPSGEEDVRR